MNLVGNAVKFTSVGEVVVRADIESVAGDEALVKIRVTDTGIGMDAAAISKIFEPFSQADETDHAQVRRHGPRPRDLPRACRSDGRARITVDSKPQIGSTFCFTFTPARCGDVVPGVRLDCLRARRVMEMLTLSSSLEEALARHAALVGRGDDGGCGRGGRSSSRSSMRARTGRALVASLRA